MATEPDQTFVGVAGISTCRHVTRSTHRASGYQQAAICYSWSSGGLDFSGAEPAAEHIMHQDNNQKTGAGNLRNTSYSQRATQLVLHRAVVISRQRGQESCHRPAVKGKGSTVDT